MPFVFRSPISYIPAKYHYAYDAVEGEGVKEMKVKVESGRLKFCFPIKSLECETIFKSRPSIFTLEHHVRFLRMMKNMNVAMKCQCGKKWYPEGMITVNQSQCPAQTHKAIKPCGQCMIDAGFEDVCGIWDCGNHDNDDQDSWIIDWFSLNFRNC